MEGVELLFGPMLIGIFLNVLLYGALVVQMFIYYQTYTEDASWIRYFMLYLFLMETVNSVFDIAIIYEPLIVLFGSHRALINSPKFLPADAITTVAISTPVQIFMAWRIKVITGSLLLSSIICFLAVASFGGGVSTTVIVTLNPEFAKFSEFHPEVVTWLTSSALCDVFLTVYLVYSLYSRRTGGAVDDHINRVIRLTMQTGILTTIFALLDVFLFLFVPNGTLMFIWDFPLSKLYTNSLISTLNARAGWQNLSGNRHLPNALFRDSEQSNGYGRSPGSRTARIASHPQAIALELNRMEAPMGVNNINVDLEGGTQVSAEQKSPF